jgi:hypothetical protein
MKKMDIFGEYLHSKKDFGPLFLWRMYIVEDFKVPNISSWTETIKLIDFNSTKFELATCTIKRLR